MLAGSEEEQAARDAWYADMDANDEWTGFTAEAHADCVLDILSFFEEHEPFINYASSRGRVGGFLPISIC
jgi:hypothetical protein